LRTDSSAGLARIGVPAFGIAVLRRAFARRFKARGRGFVAAAVLLGACLAAGARPGHGAEPLLGKKAPEFTRTDLNGHTVSLAQLRGKVVLLNFWATWCAPCEVEMPVFSAWQRQYGPQGLRVVGISMDDGAAPVRKAVARLKLDYPVAMGDARLGERYGALGLPLTYLIDRDGVVRARFQGETNPKAIMARLQALLGRR
jgi:cytochrome c biogenesis protein CcmG/thiol:disulfide interchange protein DsbE